MCCFWGRAHTALTTFPTTFQKAGCVAQHGSPSNNPWHVLLSVRHRSRAPRWFRRPEPVPDGAHRAPRTRLLNRVLVLQATEESSHQQIGHASEQRRRRFGQTRSTSSRFLKTPLRKAESAHRVERICGVDEHSG